LLTTSVRGSGVAPTTAAKAALGVKAFMKAGLGVRLVAGSDLVAVALAATFLAGAAAFFAGAAEVTGATFFAGAAAFLAGVFLAVAMMKFLWSEVGSPLKNDVFTATRMLIEKVALSKRKNHFSLDVLAVLTKLSSFSRSCQLSWLSFATISGTTRSQHCANPGALSVHDAFHKVFVVFVLQNIGLVGALICIPIGG
jgi:hypothetical protein